MKEAVHRHNSIVSQACCGVGVIAVHTEQGNHAEVGILVMQEKFLGYDLLIGINAIYALVGTVITPAGDVQLGRNHVQQSPLKKITFVLLLARKRKPGLQGRSGP